MPFTYRALPSRMALVLSVFSCKLFRSNQRAMAEMSCPERGLEVTEVKMEVDLEVISV